MADQPVAGKQQPDPHNGEARHRPESTALKANSVVERTRETAKENRETSPEIQIPEGFPGKVGRVWIWIGNRTMWTWIKRKADEASLADWEMVFFTFVLAATTVVFTVYAKRQWQAMSDQLTEMKSSGNDTRDLVNATRDLADASKKQVDLLRSQLVGSQGSMLSPRFYLRSEGTGIALDIGPALGSEPFPGSRIRAKDVDISLIITTQELPSRKTLHRPITFHRHYPLIGNSAVSETIPLPDLDPESV